MPLRYGGRPILSSGSTQIPKFASRRWLDFLPERRATARYLIGAAMAVSFISGATIVSAEVKTLLTDKPGKPMKPACHRRQRREPTWRQMVVSPPSV